MHATVGIGLRIEGGHVRLGHSVRAGHADAIANLSSARLEREHHRDHAGERRQHVLTQQRVCEAGGGGGGVRFE